MPKANTATAEVPNPLQRGSFQALRDRVKELRRVPAAELRRNEKNWRLHPDGQRSALRHMMDEVGMVSGLLAREDENGQLVLIDGHLRADMAEDAVVPVLVLDLDEKEADKVLATFDPLSTMAIADTQQLASLLQSVDLDENADLRRLFADVTDKLAKEEEDGEQKEQDHEVPGLALQPHEHYDYLVVLARSTQEWNVLCDKLKLEPTKRRGKMGTCRAMHAARLLDALK